MSVHGQSSHRTGAYKSWSNMMERCRPGSHNGKYHSERGITVCERWKSFVAFFEDMGERPEGYTLGRINNDLGYSLDNCRWETPKQQMRNTRFNRLITFKGKTQCLSAWCEELGLNRRMVESRLNIYGWTAERALSPRVERLDHKLYKNNKFGISGVTLSRGGKFHLNIFKNCKRKFVGSFETIQEAAAARVEALKEF